MITTAFIYLASGVITLLLLPLTPFKNSNGFPSSVDTAISSASTYIARADTIIPLSAVETVLTWVIAFEVMVVYFYIMRWLVSYIPGVGGR
jgi:hypothetical protein